MSKDNGWDRVRRERKAEQAAENFKTGKAEKPASTLSILVPFSGTYNNGYFDDIEGFKDWDCDFKKVLNDFAKQYVSYWNEEFEYATEVDLGLVFEEVDSPKEYNFYTDRIFATIPQTGWRKLARVIITPEGNKAMTRVAKERHTSYSGFASFYDPDWLCWGPVIGWDHNQLQTLLFAVMDLYGVDERTLEDEVYDHSAVREAIENHVVYEEDEA